MARPEKRLRRAGTRSEQVKQRRAAAAAERNARARRRYAIAAYAATVRGTLTEIRAAVVRAIEIGVIAGVTAPPSRSTLAELLERWRGGAHDVEAYRDGVRPGRPRRAVDGRLDRLVRRSLARGARSLSDVWERVGTRAEALGVWWPSRAQFVRRYGGDLIPRVAARYGSRAAQLDAIPHGTVPSRCTHACWTLDELLAPIWIRVWHRKRRAWISTKPWVILVVDVRTRTILLALLIDPGRRTDPKTGDLSPQAFTAEDVLAALLSVACRELAPSATAEFAGRLPHTLRWDLARAHRKLNRVLRKLGLEVRRLPGGRPHIRGRVERPVDTLKEWCCEIHGFDGRYVPADQLAPDARARNDDGRRSPRRLVVDPGQLLTAEEAQDELNDVVRRYNARPHRRLGPGVAPSDAYHALFPHDARAGRDALYLLEPQVLRVGAEGIVHSHRGREAVFAAFTEQHILQRDTLAEVQVDPWQRGAFVRVGGVVEFLRPVDTWAAEGGAPRTARLRAAAADAADREAAALRAEDPVRPVAPPPDADGAPAGAPTGEVAADPPDDLVADPEAGGPPISGAGGEDDAWLAGDPMDRLSTTEAEDAA